MTLVPPVGYDASEGFDQSQTTRRLFKQSDQLDPRQKSRLISSSDLRGVLFFVGQFFLRNEVTILDHQTINKWRYAVMFVNIINFPAIHDGKEAEFKEWFSWSNGEYAKHPVFVSRRLLIPREGGNYVAIVEHKSYETFTEMHTNPPQAKALERVKPLLNGSPTPQFFEGIADYTLNVLGGQNE
jgi:hypothetical protein